MTVPLPAAVAGAASVDRAYDVPAGPVERPSASNPGPTADPARSTPSILCDRPSRTSPIPLTQCSCPGAFGALEATLPDASVLEALIARWNTQLLISRICSTIVRDSGTVLITLRITSR